MPGQNGLPTQFPVLARLSRTWIGSAAVGFASKLPFAHCRRRKYWVSVSAMNLSGFSSLTELLPEFSGIIGTPVTENSSLWLAAILPSGPGSRKSANTAWRNGAEAAVLFARVEARRGKQAHRRHVG